MNHDVKEGPVLKRLISYTFDHKRALVVAFVCLFVMTGAKLSGPYLIKRFIDDFVAPGRYEIASVTLFFSLYVTLHLVAVVFDYLQSIAFQTIALDIVRHIRTKLFEHVMSLKLAYFDRTPVGVVVSRVTNDTEAVKELYVGVMSTFVQSGVQLLGTYVFLFFLEPRLAVISLGLLPLFVLVIWAYRRYSTQYFVQVREYLSRLNAQMNESLNGMNIIQQFRQEKRLIDQFEELNEAHQAARVRTLKLDSLLLRPVIEVLLALATIILLGYFGVLSFEQQVQVGTVYAFMNYIERIFRPVLDIMQRLSEFQQAVVSADRVFRMLDLDEVAETKTIPGEAKITNGRVEFKDVTFSYDGTEPVLKRISFVAEPGQTVALVGHTGSGKSSIINLLTRFYPVVEGEVCIDGQPLGRFEERELRANMGLVLQEPLLFTGTVEDNLRFYAPLTKAQLEEASRLVEADEIIERLDGGYGHVIGERGATLSSGERQLLSFARTMARNPKILILDEATSAIDTETEERVQTALEHMRSGRTTIAIAHRLSTIQDADLILVLHRGEIVERGTHAQLLEQAGLYRRMYELQSGTTLRA